MSAAVPEKSRPFTMVDQLYVSCLWFAYNLMWGALLGIIIPAQVQAIVGDAHKEDWTGRINGLGALVALVVTPIAGALSDRSRSPVGRRRPFLLAGIVINCLFLLLMSSFGTGSNVWLFLLAFAGVQFGCNWWGGPYAGLIPDVVPPEQVGRASGMQAVMTATGFLAGALAAGAVIRPNFYWPMYLIVAVLLFVFLGITWAGVRERPNTRQEPPFRLGAFIRSLWIDPKEHRDFYWVLVTRALVTMGSYSIFGFFQFFLGDIIARKNPPQDASYLLAAIMGLGIPSSIIAGMLSDRWGRKPLVYLSGGMMALVCATYVGLSLHSPSSLEVAWIMTLVAGGLFGIGNGAYQAVDWALAVDVLPGGEDAAKDMGIWHVALVLPQVIAPVISGLLLNAFKAHGELRLGYTLVFGTAAVWFILGTIFVRQIRSVR